MRRPLISIFLLFMAALTSVACGKKAKPPQAQQEQEKVEKGGISPDLVNQVHKVQAGEYAGSCDQKFKAIQLEITRDLDSRFHEIQKLMTDPSFNKNLRTVQAGPIVVNEYIQRKTPKVGWQEYSSNWEQIRADYEAIKNTATDKQWVYLAIDTSSILSDDADRVEGYNMYLKRDSETYLRKLLSLVNTCQENPNCTDLALADESLKNFISTQPFYETYTQKLSASNHDRGKFYLPLEKFKRELESDLKRYTMRKTPSVKRFSESTYELMFDGSAFPENVLPLIQSYVESIWKSPTHQVKLIWNKTLPTPSDLFKFILHLDGGSRAYVSYGKREVHLYSTVKNTSIAHEFGHVLGFKDNYYTYWNPSQCSYGNQYIETDLMSSSATGSVTDEAWEILNVTYPLSH